ncbi:EthD family reductase [Acuticoccus kandeliae]|uniref:EthD family reductase n=1 Tax=Acuticoccus kandeliae TaxID=2073160 RepID=UPI000D3E6F4C|nr:EthD family reductase [Acuticoccus kandeliae]
MSVSYFVRYDGSAEDAEEFIRYYAETHGEFMKAYPGIRKAVIHLPTDWNDPEPINRGDVFLLGEFQFDDEAALDAALASQARKDARGDAHNFPPFHGRVTHQAMKTVVLF